MSECVMVEPCVDSALISSLALVPQAPFFLNLVSLIIGGHTHSTEGSGREGATHV